MGRKNLTLPIWFCIFSVYQPKDPPCFIWCPLNIYFYFTQPVPSILEPVQNCACKPVFCHDVDIRRFFLIVMCIKIPQKALFACYLVKSNEIWVKSIIQLLLPLGCSFWQLADALLLFCFAVILFCLFTCFPFYRDCLTFCVFLAFFVFISNYSFLIFQRHIVQ